MNKITLDCEVTIKPTNTWVEGKSLIGGDPSPYDPFNQCVCICIDDKVYYEEDYHKVQEQLDTADMIIGHNLKFDLSWLKSMGFTWDCKLWDTMIYEYVLLGGQKTSLKLADVARRYGVEDKLDIIKEEYWKKGINTDAIPRPILTKYVRQDVATTNQIQGKQQEFLTGKNSKTQEMMCEMCNTLINVEVRGIKVDTDVLSNLIERYTDRLEKLSAELEYEAQSAFGDRPINLNSKEQLSELIYSKKVIDKKEWRLLFGFTENMKVAHRDFMLRKMPKSRFKRQVSEGSTTVQREQMFACNTCSGLGKVSKYTKDGQLYKKLPRCTQCDDGLLYVSTGKTAGFNVKPRSVDVRSGGFATNKETLKWHYKNSNLNEQAKCFLGKLMEYNSCTTELKRLEGMKQAELNGFIHPQFNQCISSTGRLTCSNPNFQNIPRGTTSDTKQVIISRFEDGVLLDVDFAGLEFVVGAIQANCDKAIEFICEGRDVHKFSASKSLNIPESEVTDIQRTAAKPETFGPMYGRKDTWGFYEAFPGFAVWHKRLQEEVIRNKQMSTPTGRVYKFPRAKRTSTGGVTQATKIKNYSVQGFATGDIVPLMCTIVDKALAKYDAMLVNTVHDSLILDLPKKELDIVSEIVYNILINTDKYVQDYYNIDFPIKLGVDMKVGSNWLEMTKLTINGE